jgi:hypothetical protein
VDAVTVAVPDWRVPAGDGGHACGAWSGGTRWKRRGWQVVAAAAARGGALTTVMTAVLAKSPTMSSTIAARRRTLIKTLPE